MMSEKSCTNACNKSSNDVDNQAQILYKKYYTKLTRVKNAFRHHAFPKRGVVEKTLKGI